MMREMADLSKKREVYVVVRDEGELVEIRKMEKQLRLKTYEVDRDQIFKVFNPTNNNDEEKEGDEKSKNGVKTKNDKEVKEKRKAAAKSELKTHQMALDKVVAIAMKEQEGKRDSRSKKERERKGDRKKEEELKEKEYVTIYF